jgi:cell division protein FtsQ
MDYNPPNTRERVAARRQRAQGAAPAGPTRPGLRRVLIEWLVSGRLVSGAIFLVCAVALGYMLWSPRLAVWRIEVEGNNALTPAEVAALADLHGRPIWFVDGAGVVDRLLANAYVETAEVELALPDTAIVRLVERRPEVRWLAGGVQYLVDGGGQVLGPAQEAAETDVLVIVDNSNLQLQPNDRIDTDALGLARSLALRLPNEVGLSPQQIGWDIALGVYVRSASNQLIVFGRSEHLDRKLAVLDFLLKDQTAFTYLDLRPSNPFYQNATVSTQ